MAVKSLPSRECGLKYGKASNPRQLTPSLPSRECGLKSWYADDGAGLDEVTPFAGVWIEIVILCPL